MKNKPMKKHDVSCFNTVKNCQRWQITLHHTTLSLINALHV